jgi:AcrR family transcriptional regulator
MARKPSKSVPIADDQEPAAKAKVRLDILEAMVRLENERGHLAWKISELARAAAVSRALVYYYFGRTKAEILDAGIEVLAEEYFGLTDERERLLGQGKGWESALASRRMALARPAFVVFYLRWRTQKRSPLAAKLAEIDRRYEAMLTVAYPQLSRDQIVALHGILYSVVTAPFLTDEALEVLRRLAAHLWPAPAPGKDSRHRG